MKKIGELAIPVIYHGIDSLDAALKSVLTDMTPEERKRFNEDVKRELSNPLYRIGSYGSSLLPICADYICADGS